MRTGWRRLWFRLSARGGDQFDLELEEHLALLTDKFVAQGMTREEAYYAARRQFGGIEVVRQQRRDATGFPALEALAQDLRHSIRGLAKTPLFTLTVLAALTLGIGANTAVFSVVNAVFLKPFKAPQAGRIVRFLNTGSYGATAVVGFPEFNLWRQQTSVFENISAHREDVVNLTGVAAPEQIQLARVSEGFLRLFGAPLLLGRAFTAEEDQPGGPRVAVLGYELWARSFGSDRRILGRAVTLGSDAYTVIGVLGEGFDSEQFELPPEAWVQAQIDPNTAERGSFCTVSGRLKPGVSLQTANAELRALAADNRSMLPGADPLASYAVEPLQEAMGNSVRSSLLLLLGAVSLVLLIACANVASLLLARAAGRKREIAIRSAVGAGRGRIVRQLLTESLGLSLVGGGLGLGAGLLGIRAMLSLYPGTIPRIGAQAAVSVDWRVLAFTAIVSLVTGILFGLAPALASSRADLSITLKESGNRSGSSVRHNRGRALLVISEVALTSVLLVGSALLIRSFLALRAVDPGFDSHGVATAQMSLAQTRFEKTAEMERLVNDSSAVLRAHSGVEAVGVACCIPLETVWQLSFIVQDRPLNGRRMHGMAGWTFVSPGYFDAFRIPVTRGRSFSERDRIGAPGVVIVNQTFAKQVWPNGDALGQRLIIGTAVRPEYSQDTAREVIGIVVDVRDQSLRTKPRPAMYVPLAQLPDAINVINLRLLPIAWFVRAAPASSPNLSAAITQALRQSSGGLPSGPVRSMDAVSARSTVDREFNMWLMAIFGGMALLLAVIGMYALMANSVEQRTQEIGVRMALGADRARVRAMVVWQGLRLALTGVAIGLPASLGFTRLLTSFLFGVQPRDPAVFGAVPVLLFAVALAAAWLPARAATRINPVDAVRWE